MFLERTELAKTLEAGKDFGENPFANSALWAFHLVIVF